jgi:hypothetical protein
MEAKMKIRIVPIICVVVISLLCLFLLGMPDNFVRLLWPQLLSITVSAFGVGGLFVALLIKISNRKYLAKVKEENIASIEMIASCNIFARKNNLDPVDIVREFYF